MSVGNYEQNKNLVPLYTEGNRASFELVPNENANFNGEYVCNGGDTVISSELTKFDAGETSSGMNYFASQQRKIPNSLKWNNLPCYLTSITSDDLIQISIMDCYSPEPFIEGYSLFCADLTTGLLGEVNTLRFHNATSEKIKISNLSAIATGSNSYPYIKSKSVLSFNPSEVTIEPASAPISNGVSPDAPNASISVSSSLMINAGDLYYIFFYVSHAE